MQCKCVWFSPKDHQFANAWINADFLKIIKIPSSIEPIFDISVADYFVELKTNSLEHSKKRSTFKYSNDTDTSIITADLSYVSPVMQIISYTARENIKRNKIENENSEREQSEYIVKCKYYNGYADKMSEVELPIDALKIVRQPEANIMQNIQQAILNKKYALITYFISVNSVSTRLTSSKSRKIKIELSKILIKPQKIFNRTCRFYLTGYDFYHNINIDVNILNIDSIKVIDSYFSERLPIFDNSKGKLTIELISKTKIENLIKKIGKKRFLYITYEDQYSNHSKRTLKDYSLVEGFEIDSLGIKKEYSYLKAYCCLRQAERFFRIERIRELKVLEI